MWKWVVAKVTHRQMRNSKWGTMPEWFSEGVGYSVGVGWVGKKRYECNRMSSEWNGVYEGLSER